MPRFSVADLLLKTRTSQGGGADRTAVSFEGRALTYRELDERSTQLAVAWRREGFAQGDRVGVLIHNCLEWVETFFAVAKLGGVLVPLNYLLRPVEVSEVLQDCGARWVVFGRALTETAESIRGMDTNEGMRFIGVDAEADDDVLDYHRLLESAEGSSEKPGGEVNPDDLFLLQYTSGTTGLPKGVMHTQATVMWNSFHQIVDYQISAEDVYLVVPALCWAAGFHDIALAALWRGGRIVLNPSTGFDPARFLDTVERERVTSVLLVPTVLGRVLTHPGFADYDCGALRLICSGGEPVPITSLERARELLPGCSVLQVYGMSEFPTMMLYLEARHALEKDGSTGRACSGAEIRVVDDEGNDTEPGVVGEIICRSPANMIGYYNKSDATSAALVDGWLHTGDLAHVDDEGFVYISGRSKDMLISGGLNIYPAEVERIIAQHSAVLEAAVVGEPDLKLGEVGSAMVVLHPGAVLTEQELVESLRVALAGYKIPRRFTFTEAPLPRTTSGKVQKFLVKELLIKEDVISQAV